MFTGLVEAIGSVAWIRRTAAGSALRIEAPFASELERGESVSVNGVCQTVVRSDASGFEVDAVAQTLSATTIGRLKSGSKVNLERPLRAGDRLGGHIVAGHVDGVARVTRLSRGRDGTLLTLELPKELTRYVVRKGSIAVDGVSLTVAEVSGTRATVALIPETLRQTIAGSYRGGTEVNIETDLAARHMEKLLGAAREGNETASEHNGLTEERLRELGFTE